MVADGDSLAEEGALRLIRGTEVLLIGWGSSLIPVEIARDPGDSATSATSPAPCARGCRGDDRGRHPGHQLGDAPAHRPAEGHNPAPGCARICTTRSCGYGWGLARRCAPLRRLAGGAAVGIYAWGRRPLLCRPVAALSRRDAFYDPYVSDYPADLERWAARGPLPWVEAIVIHAGSRTRRVAASPRAAVLLPDHAVIVAPRAGRSSIRRPCSPSWPAAACAPGWTCWSPTHCPRTPGPHVGQRRPERAPDRRNPPDYYQEPARLEDYHIICLKPGALRPR